MSVDLEDIAVELARRDDFVVFAGTGVCLGAGLPAWPQLLRSLEEACYSETRHSFDDPDEFPHLAQVFYDYLRSHDREVEYDAILREQLRPRNSPHSSHEREIVETTGRVVTTNFDTTFEDAFRRVFPDCADFVQRLPSFDMKKMQEQCVLVHLHGSTDDCIILKTSDYDTFYPSLSGTQGSSALERYLEYLYLNHTLVFIGFSFNDQYMKAALNAIRERIAHEDRIHAGLSSRYEPRLEKVQHYAFLQKYDVEREKERLRRDAPAGTQPYEERLARIDAIPGKETELDRFLETLHIKVTRYAEHIDWVMCLRKIQDLRQRRVDASTLRARTTQ